MMCSVGSVLAKRWCGAALKAPGLLQNTRLTGRGFSTQGGKGTSFHHRFGGTAWTWASHTINTAIVGISLYKTIKKADEINPFLSSLQASTFAEFSEEEVATHKDLNSGIWVTFEDSVYDITKFVENHPGGSKILLAAGGPIEPFWNLYTIHHSDNVKEILADMFIGKVRFSENRSGMSADDPYINDPQRHPAFMLNSIKPFDAEPPPSILIDHFITPSELFYVRNHLPVPVLGEDTYNLEVSVKGSKQPLNLSLEDLKTKFKKHTIVATLQCAGNRRREMGSFKKIYGAPGGISAISNAEWGGVLLRDVLHNAGLDVSNNDVEHIQFEGWDQDMAGEGYSASIPVDKALSSAGDVLLAYEMNGKPLGRDHGYPIRVVVPGVIGARSVKWLRRIVASDDECSSHWQQNDYKSSPPSIAWKDMDFCTVTPIYEAPVQSVICSPQPGFILEEGEDEITVKGYAWSGGGNGILRVDVSLDGGQTWKTASLQKTQQRRYHAWAWTLWEATLPVSSQKQGEQQLELCCKAIDTSHNVQPETIAGIWNLRGFLNNSWHRVVVNRETISEE